MAIEYSLLSKVVKQRGLDVTVRFQDKNQNLDKTVTFFFKDEEELSLDYDKRMNKKIDNIQIDINDKMPLTDYDIIKELDKIFQTSNTITKIEYENIKLQTKDK